MPRANIITGEKFGRLTIIRNAGVINKRTHCECLCECGEKRTIAISNLRNGHSQSCGCLARDINTTHGKSGTPTYKAWHGMVSRCHNKDHQSYHYYGSRGIFVCRRWRYDYEQFLHDMGTKPNGMSLDREDNDKGYSPDNCRWANTVTQGNNRRNNQIIEHDGEALSYAQWSYRLGGARHLVGNRIKAGWDQITAVTTHKK